MHRRFRGFQRIRFGHSPVTAPRAADPRRLDDRLAELLPDVERLVVPGASHLMHEDSPRLVNEAILDLLARRTAQPRP